MEIELGQSQKFHFGSNLVFIKISNYQKVSATGDRSQNGMRFTHTHTHTQTETTICYSLPISLQTPPCLTRYRQPIENVLINGGATRFDQIIN